MNTCMKCAHKNVCEWCIDDSEYDFPTCSDFLEERPQGEWIPNYKSQFRNPGRQCSLCGKVVEFSENFCPNCGAYMRGNDNG